MNKIGNFGAYQNRYFESAVKKQKQKEKAKSKEVKSGEAAKKASPKLSQKAQALLEELKKKYGNMDFMVANYDSDEEAASYLSRGTKEYSVLIEPEILEEMAADSDVRDKYVGMIDDATAKLSDMKEQLGDKKDEVKSLGVSIGKDGTVSYFAELEKSGEMQRERIEKGRADRKADKKAADKKAADKKAEDRAAQKLADRAAGNHAALPDRIRRVRVTAGSVEELLDKINNVDWRERKEEERGSLFDYSI